MEITLKFSLLMLVIQVSWIPPGAGKFHKDTQIFNLPVALLNNSYFGYSVTYQPAIKRLIISAPKADNIGQVFSCDIGSKACSKIKLDITRVSTKYSHNYWLGATVKAGPDYFLTCAPLSVDDVGGRNGAVSTCLQVTSNETYNVLPGISDDDRKRYTKGLTEQKMDSFGWSIDIPKNQHYLFGGPGMFTGRVMDTYNLNQSPHAIIGQEYGVEFNFGYGVASGLFLNPHTQNYAISSTYGKIGNGMVIIYRVTKSKLVKQQELQEGNSVGSMFGAVLCSARLEGDTDTLFVGAPTESHSYDFNKGAVYVYQKSKTELTLVRIIQGLTVGGQFGSVITNVGDMNGDKINDIAISAPYENDGVGAVYLYCGASIGDRSIPTLTPLQKFEQSGVKNFGISLAVLEDYDENGCNELAIGAPGNGKVVLYNCITEIPIKLDAKFPPLKKRPDNTSFTFESCFTVTYPQKLTKVTGSVQINIVMSHGQAKLANPTRDAEYIETLDIKKTEYCRDVKVSTPTGGNYNQEISYQMTAKLTQDAEALPYDRSHIMFSDRSQLIKKGSVRAAECKNDNECIPILNVTITTSEGLSRKQPYTIGSSKFENFTLSVSNEGDTAYEMCLRGRVDGAEIYQTPECPHTENDFTCKPQQALKNNPPWNLGTFIMKMDKLTSANKNISINVELYDNCDDLSQHHDHPLTIPLASSTDIAIKGNTDIDDIVNMTKSEINYFGTTISHFYYIHNSGPTTWVGLEYTLTFKKKEYIDQSVDASYVAFAARSSIRCKTISSINKDEAKVRCELDNLYGTTRKQITVPIHILPGTLKSLLDGGNETVTTGCSLEFGSNNVHTSVKTTLTQGLAPVPLWIILAACFVGFLILLLFILILVECGCMRRKNKQMLKDLKKDVRRQTIRRSMMQSEDRRRLVVEEADEATCIIDHPEDPTKEVKFHQNVANESDLQVNIKSENGQKGNPMLKELNERLTRNK